MNIRLNSTLVFFLVSYSYFSKCLIPGLGARNETLLENMNKTLRKETNYTFYLMLIPQIRLLKRNQTLANRLKYGHQIKNYIFLLTVKSRRRRKGARKILIIPRKKRTEFKSPTHRLILKGRRRGPMW